MPMGTQHLVSGIIERNSPHGLMITADDGGLWLLDCGWITYWRLMQKRGRHVMIEGIRDGFNALHVKRFWDL